MQEIKALVNDDVDRVDKEFCNLFDSHNYILCEVKNFVMGNSKRIRSILCLLYLKSNNVKISNSVINMLVAAELIHNASLLQDDIIDESKMRRGEVAFHRKFNSKVALLFSDFLLALVVKTLLKINNEKVFNIFLSATEDMCKAELNQYFNRNISINIEDYLNIISGKTASLFQAILESAAILSNININQAIKFGKLFGILFQINNDMQQDSVENDRNNGIKTAIDILGIEKTQSLKGNYKEKMREIIRRLPNREYSSGLEDLIKLL